MQFSSHKKRRAPTVIIVSLIDVLLVVLIFLMVTTAFKKEQPMFKVVLPDSKMAKTSTNDMKQPFVVTVTTNQPYFYLGTTPVTFERVESELQKRAKDDPTLRVGIRPDKWAPAGMVFKVFDAAKFAGVGSIDFWTEKPQTP